VLVLLMDRSVIQNLSRIKAALALAILDGKDSFPVVKAIEMLVSAVLTNRQGFPQTGTFGQDL
jgi:hypothetical protein